MINISKEAGRGTSPVDATIMETAQEESNEEHDEERDYLNESHHMRRLPSLIIQSASGLFSRFRRWVGNSRNEDTFEDESVIENQHTSIQLKGILKKEEKEAASSHSGQHEVRQVTKKAVEINNYETKRKERKHGRIRRGPLPIDELPTFERGPSKITHATLSHDIKKNQHGEQIALQLHLVLS